MQITTYSSTTRSTSTLPELAPAISSPMDCAASRRGPELREIHKKFLPPPKCCLKYQTLAQ